MTTKPGSQSQRRPKLQKTWRSPWTVLLMASSVCIDVNGLPERELRSQLMLVPHLASVTIDTIVRLRPFSDGNDFITRVNCEAATSKQCIGPKLCKYFHVDTDTFIRPQGRAPTIHTERGNIKVACAWDESHGCWQALDGSQHMPLRTITKRSLEHSNSMLSMPKRRVQQRDMRRRKYVSLEHLASLCADAPTLLSPA
jgi:hypothetical protein